MYYIVLILTYTFPSNKVKKKMDKAILNKIKKNP